MMLETDYDNIDYKEAREPSIISSVYSNEKSNSYCHLSDCDLMYLSIDS